MANIDKTYLWADDPVKFDKITYGLTFDRQCELYKEPGKLFVETAGGVPHDEIKELSAKHPDVTFYAEHSFEYNLWSEVWTIEYKAGVAQEKKLVPEYMFVCQGDRQFIERVVPCYSELESKAIEVFRRVDRTVKESVKGIKIDWCKDEVTVTVEHDGYRMQATKILHEVDNLKFFKAHEIKTVEWQEMDTKDICEIPF